MRATANNARKELTREDLIDTYVNRIRENKEQEAKLKQVRQEHIALRKEADKLEDHLKNIQNTGQLIGEILKHLDSEK